MSNPQQADYRIIRYNGEYRVEVLDKPYCFWYIVVSRVKTLQEAVEYCEEHFEKGDKE